MGPGGCAAGTWCALCVALVFEMVLCSASETYVIRTVGITVWLVGVLIVARWARGLSVLRH